MTSRRIFRGLSGATDRNLPKHQARKRKNERKKLKLPNESQHTTTNPSNDLHQTDGASQSIESEEHGLQEKYDESSISEDSSSSIAEIWHCRKRIRNVQESIQLSDSVIPRIWQENTLNAVLNCVKEAFAILNHYKYGELDINLGRELSLALFTLVQLSMQSGPLAGGKPGYFKRCGSDVSKMALRFLEDAFPEDVLRIIGFTEKQSGAIQKWKSNAQKGIEMDKTPSKSVLKKRMKNRK